MKQSIAYILLLNYLTIIFSPALPLLDYFLHLQQYEETCENKDNPEMHCNGQCHLEKNLKPFTNDTQNSTQNKATIFKIKFKEFTLYYRKFQIVKFYKKLQYTTCKKRETVKKTGKGFLSKLFKPPQYIS